MRKMRYAPQNIISGEKIFLPDHPCSDKQGFISIDHSGFLNELTSNIKQKIKHRKMLIQKTTELLAINKNSDNHWYENFYKSNWQLCPKLY